MHFNIITVFPEFFDSSLATGLLYKARERGLVDFSLVNPRDFALDRHRSVDDRPYGGGPGMVMSLPPLWAALKSISNPGRIIQLSPQGRLMDQALARELSAEPFLTLVCGRYEGIDARFKELAQAEEVSIGDFVLNGGECAALCLIEAVSRLLPGFMGCQASVGEESFSSGLLEYPHYTRPEEFSGLRVPEVLLSGHHERIRQWRRRQSLLVTLCLRPELLTDIALEPWELSFLRKVPRTVLGRNLYLCLVHSPVLNKSGQVTAVSLTNLDIHDIARVCRTYSVSRYYLQTPIRDQQLLAKRLIAHWLDGPGYKSNPDRAKAMAVAEVVDSLDAAIQDIVARTGEEPVLVATSARGGSGFSFGQVRDMLRDHPVLLVFGTGSGLAPAVLERCAGQLGPIRMLSDYNHLSVRSAVSITVDRLLSEFY